MRSKKKLLKESSLYIVIDKIVCAPRLPLNIAGKIVDGDVNIIQFRDKESKKENIIKDVYALRKSLNSNTIFIVNDYLDVAKMLDCDGIHLGQDDLGIEIVRRILGEDKIIGISCHNLRQAIKAQYERADYISIGPIFSTPTKPEYKSVGLDLIKDVSRKIKVPVFAIGGIDESNIEKVLSSGAKRVAVCRAVCRADNIIKAVKRLKKHLKNQI